MLLTNIQILERACTASYVFLPSLPPAKEDMVQLKSVWWSFSSKSKVCLLSMKQRESHHFLVHVGWFTASLVPVCCPHSTSTYVDLQALEM